MNTFGEFCSILGMCTFFFCIADVFRRLGLYFDKKNCSTPLHFLLFIPYILFSIMSLPVTVIASFFRAKDTQRIYDEVESKYKHKLRSQEVQIIELQDKLDSYEFY